MSGNSAGKHFYRNSSGTRACPEILLDSAAQTRTVNNNPQDSPEEKQDDVGQAQVPFDDNTTSVGTPEENQDDVCQAQVPFGDNAAPIGTPEEVQDDVDQPQNCDDDDDGASDSSGPPMREVVDSTSEDEDPRERNI
jgi:hypothetical protein